MLSLLPVLGTRVARPSGGVHAVLCHCNTVQLALIRPISPPGDEFCFHRILQFVEPLFTVAFTVAKLAVEEILLPDRFLLRMRPTTSRICAPEFHPTRERGRGNLTRGAKEMKLIRHNNVSSDKPVIRLAPRFQEDAVNFRSSQQRTALGHVATDELDYGLVRQFAR